MEGAPVTAATGVLGPVVAKLGALMGSQYKLRRRTRKDVKFIKSKLKSVHSILWMVWEKEDLDAESKVLRKEALDLAADMEDAIDDFILTMERSHRNKHLMVQSKIEASCPFQDFRTRVDQVSGRCCSKWKWKKNKCAEPISSLFSRKNAKSSAPSELPPPRAPFVRKDPSELVGMDEWRNDLIKYLVGEEEERTMVQPQLKMASIVGMAGVGKTSLADLVYEKIGDKFQSRAFVSLTPSPNMKEVLTSILQQVQAVPLTGTEARTEEEIIHAISNFLADKRYLVIIDDIWHREEWDIISKSFPENNLGSRIVMTSRIHSVLAGDFTDNKLCIKMNPEWNFVRRRWLYRPDEQDVASLMKPHMFGKGLECKHPIVRMCGDVPLAVVCMLQAVSKEREKQAQQGLHAKTSDVQDTIFKQVKENGIQNTPGFEPLVQSLQLAYDDLPHHMLKTCLLYCSIYPEDFQFYLNDLVMRWVAEGFIHTEDAAKDYFKELCNRGLMLWVNSIRRDYRYQMNPMMRNFLRMKSREDNFITCSSDITSTYARRIHRLCIDYYPEDDGAVEAVDPLFGLDWSQIRSLAVFEGVYPGDDGAVEAVGPLFGLDWFQIRSLAVFEGVKRDVPFDKLKRVRMLDLRFSNGLGNHHVKDICGLLRVRHIFGLHGTGISEMPPEIARLQCLETLQVRRTRIRELPGEIRDLQQLKTLDISGNEYLAELPREMGNLENLETLRMGGTKITKLNGEIIGKLKMLKTLDMNMKINGMNQGITELPREIGDLKNLETLDLSFNFGLTKLPREIGNLQNLKQLLLTFTQVLKLPKEIKGLKKLKKIASHASISELPWEAAQFSELEGVPECVREVMKNSDVLSCELAGEILSIQMVIGVGDRGGLIVGTKHMHIPRWIKDHFSDLSSLDIRICKLEEQDLKILRQMPNLKALTLRFDVVPRKPIAISGEGFPRLTFLNVDCRVPPLITFQEGAMPMLENLCFQFRFCGGGPPANEDPQLGIKHLRCLEQVKFRCNEEWYGGAAESESMSAMIDVVRKEAQEHPNEMYFGVSRREPEMFPAKKKSSQSQEACSSNTSGMGEIEEEE